MAQLRTSLRSWPTVVAWSLLNAATASAQVYAPQPPGYPVPLEAIAAAPTIGNPFLRNGPPRATLLGLAIDDRVVPASFDRPLPLNQPIATPTPSVAPLAAVGGASQQPLMFPPVDAAPIPLPPQAAQPDVFRSQSPSPPRQSLTGVALLTEQRLTPDGRPAEHPLMPVVRWAEEALGQSQALNDYACTFTKREFVDGRLQEQQVVFAKVRHQPQSVYLQFMSPSEVKGQEALYVAGRNNGNMLAHAVGLKALAGTVSLAPNDPMAMDGNRHAITDFGLRRLLERYFEGCVVESQYGECDVRVVETARVNDRPCTCIQIMHPVPRREFPYHLTRLYVDRQWNLPIRYESYDWPRRQGEAPQLLEEYTYQGLQLNIGLGDADFDSKNPNYRF